MGLGVWVCVVTAAMLVIPGAVIARRLGLGWPIAMAAGPPVTFAVVGGATVVYGALGVPWNLCSAAVAAMVVFVAAWVFDRFVGFRLTSVATESDAPPLTWTGAAGAMVGLLVGAVIIAVTCIRPLVVATPGGLDNIPQVWDALWHASSLRFIDQTGVASSLRMGELMNYDTHGFNFYPNAWHGLGALEFRITGANPVELYNTYSPAVLALTVPLGVAGLTYWLARHRYSTQSSALVAGVGAAASGLFGALPYAEVTLTSVPNAVGVSMAPVAAVLTISTVADRRRILPAALAVSGVTVTHPSGVVLTAVIVGSAWLFEILWRPVRCRAADLGTMAGTGVLALVFSAPVIYGTLRIAEIDKVDAFDARAESTDIAHGLAQGAANTTAPLRNHGVWWLVALAAVGLGVMVWLRCWAAIVTWGVFVLAAANTVAELGVLSGPLGALGGYFYNSSHRLTFVASMFSAAAVGLALGSAGLLVARACPRWIRGSAPAGPRRLAVVPIVFAVLIALVAGVGMWRYPVNSEVASRKRDGRLVGAADLAAYAWLAGRPDAHGGVILNNLDQGTGWLYPVTGLTPLFPFYRANHFSTRQTDLFWNVGRIGADPHIDALVRDLDVRYVIDSPPSYWEFQQGLPNPAAGHQGDPFFELRHHGAPGLTPVFRQGRTTVYRVTLPRRAVGG
ncbi:MAG: hypothetical protein QM662_05380 [Gordonia sp. (in: high G+C Gram-positive bacteria)]